MIQRKHALVCCNPLPFPMRNFLKLHNNTTIILGVLNGSSEGFSSLYLKDNFY